MKLALALFALTKADDVIPDDTWSQEWNPTGAVARSGGTRSDGERRDDDVEEIMKKVWRKGGSGKFDVRKYWAYGCHCFLLGDRPLSEMGKGQPKDSLDNVCKAYKDCQKCVRANHGDTCIGEFVAYNWKFSNKQQSYITSDTVDSCSEQLFQCDLKFAIDSFANKNVFSNDYHMFWSETGFDKEEDIHCPTGGSAPVEHSCCGGSGNPHFWMNENTHTCVDNQPSLN